MTDSDDVRAEVVRRLVEASDAEIDAGAVTDETDLRADLDLSSLQAVVLVMDLEEEFGVTIEDEEVMELRTVADVLRLLEAKRGEGDRVQSS